MGRRKWKLYQDVLVSRNHPLQADSLSEPPEQDPQDLSDQEDPPMIATTDRQPSATDLSADADNPKPRDAPDKPPPEETSTLEQETAEPKEEKADAGEEPISESKDDSAVQNVGIASLLKIKTIEEINTVSRDAGASGERQKETILESLIKRSSTGPPRRPTPADWKPQEKCYFCVDGELVRPAVAPQEPPPEQPPSPVESDSECSSSRSAPSPARGPYLLSPEQQAQAQTLAHLLQLQQRAQHHPTMNQVQSMAVSLAAVAALGGGGAGLQGLCPPGLLPPHWYVGQRATPTPDSRGGNDARVASPAAPEQPLDLSARPGPASPGALEARLAAQRGVPLDHKNLLNRARPRLAAAGGRRAYSEAELQMALRDIQSGRLGTRRAAVIYNIPRSTLRNKVYKLAVERDREARLPPHLASAADRDDSNDMADDGDDDKNSVMDEDKDEDRDRPMLSMEDILRFSQTENPGYSSDLRNLLKGGQKFFDIESPKRDLPPDVWPNIEPNSINPYIHSLLLAGYGAPVPKPEESNTAPMMPEIVRLLAQEQNILKEQLMKQEHMNNGKPADMSEDDMAMNKRILSRQSSSASSVITRNDITTPGRKTDSPHDDVMEVEPSADNRDSPSNVILRIPSFKPLATATNSGKNGGETFHGPATPPLPYFSRSPHPDGGSASGPRSTDRSSPSLAYAKRMFSLKDVIAKSISDKFQQVPPNHNNDMGQMKVGSPAVDAMEGLNAFKGRGRLTPPHSGQGISVIKNLTTHDLTRSFSNTNSASQNQQNNAAGGKGTRPKRGKYRNYDRDSLVEAVKAVQRGEMSVHRAGSYYGVPHSTLEYKVKERHLMRPRKREPKNPTQDEKPPVPSASKPADIPCAGIPRGDKPKVIQKPPGKPNFHSASPNGLKMPPIFDGGLGLGYNTPPFPFWPHAPAFHGLPVDFAPRNPGTSAGFPSNSESFFASQMIQRLQEESARHPGVAAAAQKNPSLVKSAREMAEMYDNANGAGTSFLEGIIRSTLEQPPQRRSQESAGEPEDQEGSRRRLRPDDVILAEEMREAARRLRARESSGIPPAPHPPHPS